MATPQKSPKTMSSKLLTMKFMQRAAASASPSSPDTPDGRAAKRQRVSDSTRKPSGGSDYETVQAALAAEDQQRLRTLERQAAEAGDTKWVLNFENSDQNATTPPLSVVNAGYSAIDTAKPFGNALEAEPEAADQHRKSTTVRGRKTFGNFKKVNEDENQDKGSAAEDSSQESDADGSDSQRDAERGNKPRGVGRKGERKRNAMDMKTREMDDSPQNSSQSEARRKNKEVKLSKLTSISGGGSSSRGPSDVQKCFRCGSTKHKKKDCPTARNTSGKRSGGSY